MSAARTAAEREEQAELNLLRDQAERTAGEAAQTLAELTRRITVARRPGTAARRLTADALASALQAIREEQGKIASWRRVWRPALAAVPVLALAAALAYAAQRKAKSSHPRRVRTRPAVTRR